MRALLSLLIGFFLNHVSQASTLPRWLRGGPPQQVPEPLGEKNTTFEEGVVVGGAEKPFWLSRMQRVSNSTGEKKKNPQASTTQEEAANSTIKPSSTGNALDAEEENAADGVDDDGEPSSAKPNEQGDDGATDCKPNEEPTKPTKRRGFFSRKAKVVEEDSDGEVEETKVPTSNEPKPQSDESDQEPQNDESYPNPESTNSTQPQQPDQDQQQARPPPTRFSPHDQHFRKGSGPPPKVIVLGSQSGNQNIFPQDAIPSPSALVEVVTSVLATTSRWFFLRWIARRMAHFEDYVVPTQQFVWERLNDRFDRDTTALRNILRKPPSKLRPLRWKSAIRRFQGRKPPQRRILANLFRRTVVVIPIDTGSKSDDHITLDSLPEVVSFLIRQQNGHAFGTDKTTGEPLELEVVFVIESPGGSASYFGKAASHITRLREHPYISTTVCVDEIAASGGYMLASQADRILAAPFAIVGSIGVIREGFNFYEVAKRYGVQPLILKAGQNKNPLSTWGPVSRGDIEAEQVRLRKTHTAFQDLVTRGRPMLSASIMDGSVFLGEEALNLGMVDEVITSEQYLHERIEYGDRVLKLHRAVRRYSRRMSPFDILPHLRTHLSKVVAKFHKDEDSVVALLVQAGAWVGFLRHLLCKYGPLLQNNR